MKRLYLFLIVAISLIGCSERANIENVTGSRFSPDLASSNEATTQTFYLAAVDWDGASTPEHGVFYRTRDIVALKNVFAADNELVAWLNTLPQKTAGGVIEDINSANNSEPEILGVIVTSVPAPESTGPMLAALTWTANATITVLNGGATARCSTTTTNPANVTGYKAHQIWIYNQYGKVYFADGWSTTDLLEHTVNLSHDQSVACDSTVICLGRVLLDGNIKAADLDSYVRSCN